MRSQQMPGLDAVSQLSRLATRVKYDVAPRLIEQALVAAAERNNVHREDLEDMSVPSCSLDGEAVKSDPSDVVTDADWKDASLWFVGS